MPGYFSQLYALAVSKHESHYIPMHDLGHLLKLRMFSFDAEPSVDESLM